MAGHPSAKKAARPKQPRPSRAKPTRKISISIGEDELRWVQKRARQYGSVSAVLVEAARRMRREEARRALLETLGDAAEVTAEERESILASWRGQ